MPSSNCVSTNSYKAPLRIHWCAVCIAPATRCVRVLHRTIRIRLNRMMCDRTLVVVHDPFDMHAGCLRKLSAVYMAKHDDIV